MRHPQTLVARLRSAGVEPGDSNDLRIRKSIMVFAMGLMTAAPMFWLVLYRLLGLQLSATLPFAFQVVSVVTLVIYIVTGGFRFFQYAQLGLFLYFPFVVQLSIGNFISASGVVLWGILAPIIAIPVLGPRASVPWFMSHVIMLVICGLIDFMLAGTAATLRVPSNVSVVFFTLNFIAISAISYFLLQYAAKQKEAYQSELEDAHRLLQIEQDKSERLLLNILPGPVAERLKRDDGAVADGFANVTVMFADIVNFTHIAEGMAPSQIFAMLNKIFSGFDALADKHGLEKIKTIGDAYMVAGGLNAEEGPDYTDKIADMALDMCDMLAHDKSVNELCLEIRIGIGTGPIVAGVVGKKKFIYDLWGDSVNMASRITSEGVPGMIQTDATTYRRLHGRFDFHPPQTLYLKSKGETLVYRLIGRTPGAHEGTSASLTET